MLSDTVRVWVHDDSPVHMARATAYDAPLSPPPQATQTPQIMYQPGYNQQRQQQPQRQQQHQQQLRQEPCCPSWLEWLSCMSCAPLFCCLWGQNPAMTDDMRCSPDRIQAIILASSGVIMAATTAAASASVTEVAQTALPLQQRDYTDRFVQRDGLNAPSAFRMKPHEVMPTATAVPATLSNVSNVSNVSTLSIQTTESSGSIIWTTDMEQSFRDFVLLLKAESRLMEVHAKRKSYLTFLLFVVMFAAPSILLLESFATIDETVVFWLRLSVGVGALLSAFVYRTFQMAQNAINDVQGSVVLDRMARDALFELNKPRNHRRPADVYFAELEDKRDQIKRGKMTFMLDMMLAYSSGKNHADLTATTTLVKTLRA